MRYLPLTEADRREMLARIGVPDVDALFRDVPESARLKAPIAGLPMHQGELEVERHLSRLAAKNVTAGSVPFFIGAGSVILLSFYTNMFFLVLLPVVIFIMRQMARRDEMIFRLLGLKLQVRMKVRNLDRHDGMWVFSPNTYRDPRKKYPDR